MQAEICQIYYGKSIDIFQCFDSITSILDTFYNVIVSIMQWFICCINN